LPLNAELSCKGDSMSLKVDHVTILVKSLTESMPYYEKLLALIGFTKLRDFVWTDNEGFFLQFNQAKEDSKEYERYGAGMNHIGFSAPSPEFVVDVQKKMKEVGFVTPEIQNFDGVKALFMKDPDGIRFEITYYPPGMAVVD
jgi:lactoylglutathione lyase